MYVCHEYHTLQNAIMVILPNVRIASLPLHERFNFQEQKNGGSEEFFMKILLELSCTRWEKSVLQQLTLL
jgi:hypothetical protein